MSVPAGQAPHRCVVCGAPASPLVREGAPLCASPACAWTLRTTPAERRCGVCRRPLAPAELAAGVCADATCQRRWAAGPRQARARAVREAREARMRREWVTFEGRALRVRAIAARRLGVAAPEAFPVAAVPYYGGHTTRLPAHRRRLFERHLRQVIAESRLPAPRPVGAETGSRPDDLLPRDAPAADPPLAPELAGALAAGCGACRGKCCSNAGERAYLSADTIRRYRAAHPGATDDAIAEAYLRHVGRRSYDGSCVYHAVGGCTLPRDMRAGICNRFLCTGLRVLRDRYEQGGGALRAFVMTTGTDAPRAAFVDRGEVRVARRRLPVLADPALPT